MVLLPVSTTRTPSRTGNSRPIGQLLKIRHPGLPLDFARASVEQGIVRPTGIDLYLEPTRAVDFVREIDLLQLPFGKAGGLHYI